MKITKCMKKIKITNIILLTIAGIINAFGVVVFLAPVKLYDSGISGTSMLISQVTPAWCSLSLILILLNVPVFIFGLKKKGMLFTIYAIYSVLIYSLCAWIITDVLPVDVSIVSPLAGTDLFLCAIFGGIISGCGSGMAIRFGGAIDGIDIISKIFSKKFGLSFGTFVMIYNVILYIICGIVINSWILPLYSIVTYAAASKTVDYIVDGFDRAKAAIIITMKTDKVCAALSETFENGITILDAKGYYSGSEKGMLYFVLNRFQIGTMREIVHEIDPTAYISINDVADIYSANNNKNL